MLLKKVLLPLSTLLLLPLSLACSAEWVGSVHLFALHTKDGDFQAEVPGLALALGRQINLSSKISVTPELRLGKGLGGDSVPIVGTDLELKLDRLFSLAARTQYQLTQALQFFAMPVYTNTEFTASAAIAGLQISETADDWDLGLGVGASYTFDDKVSGDLMFEYYEGKTLISLGARFSL